MVFEKKMDEIKLLHARVSIGDRTRVKVLVDTSSACKIIQKSFYVKQGVMVSPFQQLLTSFNGSSSKVIGLCKMDVKVEKWQAKLPFHVMSHGMYPELGYPDLKALIVGVDCVRDCLVWSDGEVFLCNSIKEKQKKS